MIVLTHCCQYEFHYCQLLQTCSVSVGPMLTLDVVVNMIFDQAFFIDKVIDQAVQHFPSKLIVELLETLSG